MKEDSRDADDEVDNRDKFNEKRYINHPIVDLPTTDTP